MRAAAPALDPPLDTQNPRPAELSLPPAPVRLSSDGASDSTEPLATVRAAGPPVVFGDTPLAIAFRFVEPTWRNYIMYVDLEARTGNLDAARYLATWKALPPVERRSHVPEQICELASVAAADLVSWVSRQVWQEGSAAASMCMSFMRARVIAKTAEFAMDSPDNYKHAELFAKTAGLLPVSGAAGGRGGGSPITIFNAPVASSGSVALSGSRSESSPVAASGLRAMDEEIVELSKIMQGTDDVDLTPVPKCAAELLDNEEDDDESDDEDDTGE